MSRLKLWFNMASPHTRTLTVLGGGLTILVICLVFPVIFTLSIVLMLLGLVYSLAHLWVNDVLPFGMES